MNEQKKVHGNTGHLTSKATRKLISDKLKGKIPKNIVAGWNKGKKRTWNKRPNWKGGKTNSNEKGYIMIFEPNHPFAKQRGYVLEHRIVVEKFIGRYLRPEEVVHHINENKQDNRIENLMLFKNNKEHMKFHTKIKQVGFTTPVRRQIENRWKEYGLEVMKFFRC